MFREMQTRGAGDFGRLPRTHLPPGPSPGTAIFALLIILYPLPAPHNRTRPLASDDSDLQSTLTRASPRHLSRSCSITS
jgi:hypothetical protein